ncbi:MULTISPECIES: Abi family protein [unclassified Actinomyces]|uniref:Abi family protein n=1 Tax=unclassified Actinomyces TaxID=2609248 RepID=UPI000D59CE29|nr:MULTISPECIES: Abi family protein [unclassified Actinomyces]RAX24137.1 Abi family protein [Actinomyces sp. Z3]
MSKTWLSLEDQVARLRRRGLIVDDDDACRRFLSQVSYYRFSGYFRYWQRSPDRGDNRFIEGASFSTIREVYETEQTIAALTFEALQRLEILLRTTFAHHYAQHASPEGALTHGKGLTQNPRPNEEPIEEHVLRDLDRSKEAYVSHYRDESKKGPQGEYLADAYDHMPVWAISESLSFGTLSRCIQACSGTPIIDNIAYSLGVARAPLASQVRSLVYLRNRIAHHARIWNHSVLDAPQLPKNIRGRAKRNYGNFEPRSIFTILVILDRLLTASGISATWLSGDIWPHLENNPLTARGFLAPSKYGQMDLTVT